MSGFDRLSLTKTYSWTEDDKSRMHKIINDDNIIDKTNGYQVLDFMNRFFKMSGLMTLDSFQKLEDLLCKHLPEKCNTRGEINDWLGNNWNKEL